MKPSVKIAAAVLLPPIFGNAAYFGPNANGIGHFAGNYLFVASVSLVWWPFARFLRMKTFAGGLIGVHLAMIAFLIDMAYRLSDDLGWLFYFPTVIFGLIVGVIASRLLKEEPKASIFSP